MHDDIYRFFQEVNRKVLHRTLNLIYFEPYSPRRVKARGINKVSHVFPDIIKERRYLKMEKVVDEFIGWEEINEMVKDFDYNRFKVFDVGNYSVIYFDDSLMEAGYITGRDVFHAE